MKRFGLCLAAVAAVMIISSAPVFAEDYHRPVRKSFFTVNPSLRADVLAQQVAERENELLQEAFDPMSLMEIELEERKALSGDQWNEFGFWGLRMSLSRFELEQDAKRRDRSVDDDTLLVPDFRSIFLRGSFGKDDFEALGEFFRPQLKLGIEF